MSNPTTIRDVRFFAARSALSRPIADATHTIPAIEFIVCDIELANGVDRPVVPAVVPLLAAGDRAAHAATSPPSRAGAMRPPRRRSSPTGTRETEYFGQEGLQRWALGLANVAMWDAQARTLDVPVWRMLGGAARPVPVYGSGGWLSYSDDELLDEVRGYVRRGFAAVKIKVGSPEPGRDLARMRMVREAVGPHVRVMIDANQGMRAPEALELALAARDIGIGWFEEPIDHRDWDGYAFLRNRAGVALAMGEREYDLVPLRELDRAPRASTCGSPTCCAWAAWRRGASPRPTRGAHGVPVLPHYYRDYDVPLLCTIRNGQGAESFDWIDGIVDAPLRVEGGLRLSARRRRAGASGSGRGADAAQRPAL